MIDTYFVPVQKMLLNLVLIIPFKHYAHCHRPSTDTWPRSVHYPTAFALSYFSTITLTLPSSTHWTRETHSALPHTDHPTLPHILYTAERKKPDRPSTMLLGSGDTRGVLKHWKTLLHVGNYMLCYASHMVIQY